MVDRSRLSQAFQARVRVHLSALRPGSAEGAAQALSERAPAPGCLFSNASRLKIALRIDRLSSLGTSTNNSVPSSFLLTSNRPFAALTVLTRSTSHP